MSGGLGVRDLGGRSRGLGLTHHDVWLNVWHMFCGAHLEWQPAGAARLRVRNKGRHGDMRGVPSDPQAAYIYIYMEGNNVVCTLPRAS